MSFLHSIFTDPPATQCTIFWTFQTYFKLLGNLCDVTCDVKVVFNMAANTKKRYAEIMSKLWVIFLTFVIFFYCLCFAYVIVVIEPFSLKRMVEIVIFVSVLLHVQNNGHHAHVFLLDSNMSSL